VTIADVLAAVFDAAGARGYVHARAVNGASEVGLDADAPVVTASVFKVPVLLELARQAAAGELDLTERVVVPAGRRTVGPTGLSVMLDDVEVSVRDLAFMMMSVSDNTATDVLMERVGAARMAATLESLGLHETVVPDDCAGLLAGLAADLGIDLDSDTPVAFADIDPALFAKARALDPLQTNRTTSRDMTRLLSLIWTDQAGPPAACAEVRRIMALQVWPHRLSSGFPDGVSVAGKTGTLPGIRNEAGVVTYPDGEQYAVAVFTVARSLAAQQPAIDAAIGTAARLAVDALRDGVRSRPASRA
jgi:beta-lactamase class A